MITPEVFTHLPEITEFIGFLGIALAFSKAQHTFIMDRDKKCQLPEAHDCNTGTTDQAHHIIGQRYAEIIGLDPDYVQNGVRLCLNAHVGEIRPGVPGVHPDMVECKKKYKTNKNAFKEMFAERDRKLANRQIAHNPKWDRQLHVIANLNTQKYVLEGHPIPEKRKHVERNQRVLSTA